ncbi:hypothetical protein NDU88_003456 [Pleurodeles waltl]|uniref:Uncharacterized protein n=1 Tax=Pleurodeles waltl TaxID=8319 RepID=A0AAV7M3F5_PLEWA|nr:hypothetical protein NDU88_003456 [Pleurodeles waltl]
MEPDVEEERADTVSEGREEREWMSYADHKEPKGEQKVEADNVRQGGEEEKRHTSPREQEEETDVWFDVFGHTKPEMVLHRATA